MREYETRGNHIQLIFCSKNVASKCSNKNNPDITIGYFYFPVSKALIRFLVNLEIKKRLRKLALFFDPLEKLTLITVNFFSFSFSFVRIQRSFSQANVSWGNFD